MSVIQDLRTHPDAFVSVKELADYLNVSPRHIQRQIEKGALPARKFGRTIRIATPDARRYVGTDNAGEVCRDSCDSDDSSPKTHW